MAGAFQNTGFQPLAFQEDSTIAVSLDVGAFVLAGQDLDASLTVGLAAGAYTIAGQTLLFSLNDNPGYTNLMPGKAGPSGATFSRKRYQKLIDDEAAKVAAIAAKAATEKRKLREIAKAKALAEKAGAHAALQAHLAQLSLNTRQTLDANLMGGAQAPHGLHAALMHAAAVNAMGHAARQAREHAMRHRRARDDEDAMALLLDG